MKKEINLCLKGGGACGVFYIGVIAAIEEINLKLGLMGKENIKVASVTGTSAGGIVAFLMCMNYPSSMISYLLQEIDKRTGKTFVSGFLDKFSYKEIIDDRISSSMSLLQSLFVRFIYLFPYMRTLYALRNFGGVYSGEYFREWVEYQLVKSNLPKNLTMSQFGKVSGKLLRVVATDVTNGKPLVLDKDTAPDLPVSWALRMTMSIPCVWREVVWKKEFGLYKGKDIEGARIVDGGLHSNFPLAYTPTPLAGVDIISGSPDGCNEVFKQKKNSDFFRVFRIPKKVWEIFEVVRTSHDREITDRLSEWICNVHSYGLGTLDFDVISQKELMDIFIGKAKNSFFSFLCKRFELPFVIEDSSVVFESEKGKEIIFD